MRKIFPLSQHIISKIAAGEVIERPAYAVKELIENAIDAKASVIEIHVEESGLKRITVIDNGEGMSREDLEMCFLPHTTSKINEDDGLMGITSLGFRGEALSSLAAVSDMEIKSRTKDEVGGTVITLHHGKPVRISPTGMPVGTEIIVNNLFSSIPARKKFLKSQKTEFRQITEMIMRYALSYSSIHFVLTHNKKTIFDLPQKSDKIERIGGLLGSDIEHMVPISFEDGYIQLSGFLGKPHIASKYNQKQYIFINSRWVSDKLITVAVREAYGTLLPSLSTPVFLLTISLPHEMVDVNVHPRKEQVAYLNAKELFDTVKHAVTQTLSDNNLTFRLAKFKEEIGRGGETQSIAGLFLKEEVLDKSLSPIEKNTPVLQLFNTYLLVNTKDGIVIIDQHAAHERILYEQFVVSFHERKKKKEVFRLSKLLSLKLSISEAQVLEENKEEFLKIGFEIEEFGQNSFVIRQVPLLFKGRNVEKIIKDMLADLSQDSGLKSIDSRSQRMLAFLACRSAVMAGEKLSQTQAKKILQDLEKTANNTTCPHGRPTTLAIAAKALHGFFKRR